MPSVRALTETGGLLLAGICCAGCPSGLRQETAGKGGDWPTASQRATASNPSVAPTPREPVMPPAESPPNRLIHEKSPYLRQHAHNPVAWFPWGEEAFNEAQREQKPIFLSIGYSTCHWCHVMERESFEDPQIAALLNRSFIAIKVDREEHPDVDQVYLSAVMAMTGQGGWPLTVFLTPDRKPFFGGTYFPPERRWNVAGLPEVLAAVATAWERQREDVHVSAERVTRALQEALARPASSETLSVELLTAAFRDAATTFDAAHGGFGQAPKFPRSHELSFLLRYWARTHEARALDMVTTTLEQLARGGIHDQLGGGFHRYATDAQWRVPHFEKMLYDQALLAATYLDAYRITRRADFADAARGIFAYVLRELADPGGGFYAAEDADSEGHEGAYYLWTPKEIEAVLGPREAAWFMRVYGVTPEGAFEGASLLHLEHSLADLATRERLDPRQLDARLAAARAQLLAARAKRARPHRDEKILTSWNGLMIAALADGGTALNEPRYVTAASQAAAFILSTLHRDGSLLRRFCDGEARYAGTLEDYAFFLHGLLALYEADFNPRWLAAAKELADTMITRFWDEAEGGWFLRDRTEAPLLLRTKEFYDGATPSGNSIAALVLLKLGRLTADDRLEAYGQRTIARAIALVRQAPFGYPQLLSAADFSLGPTQEIVIAGPPEAEATQRLLAVLREPFLPRAVWLLHPAGPSGAAIETLAPSTVHQTEVRGQPAAYVCEGSVCHRPTTDPAAFAEQLRAAAPEAFATTP